MERWLTLPDRGGIRNEGLYQLVTGAGDDYGKVWDGCQDPAQLLELAIVAGLPVPTLLDTVGKVCADAWSHWSGGATDTRPMQVVNAVMLWVSGRAGFEEIWATWELAEALQREVRAWYSQQQGAVLATAIVNNVEAVHRYATTARNVAEPEVGHDQHDPARYAQKNASGECQEWLFGATEAVHLATTAGSWWHSHSEPNASQADHEVYAQQIVGFILRQNLPAEQVASGLQRRLA